MLRLRRFRLVEWVVWRYKYGADYEFHVKMEIENFSNPSYVLPTALESMPELDTILDTPYVEAFYMLDSSRPVGFGLGMIPLSEITNLWDRIELGDEEEFIRIIQGADMAYIKAYNDDPKNKPST